MWRAGDGHLNDAVDWPRFSVDLTAAPDLLLLSGHERDAVIRINYHALGEEKAREVVVSDDLLTRAKKRFGFGARRELLEFFVPLVRLQAMEVAQRQWNPQQLMKAGLNGVLDALKVYDIGQTEQHFKEFATPFIKRAMQTAKSKMQTRG